MAGKVYLTFIKEKPYAVQIRIRRKRHVPLGRVPAKTLTYARYTKLSRSERKDALLSVTKANLTNTLRTLHYVVTASLYTGSQAQLCRSPRTRMYCGILSRRFARSFVRSAGWSENMTSERAFIRTNSRFYKPETGDYRKCGQGYTIIMTCWTQWASRTVPSSTSMSEALTVTNKARFSFRVNLKELPDVIKQRMTLENDDKTYTSEETLSVCEQEGIPFVFDYHHFTPILDDADLDDILPRMIKTWQRIGLKPKVHLSSPKSESAVRSHADYVDANFILPVLERFRQWDADIDFMIEAKEKDRALLRLVEELSAIRGVKRLAGGVLRWKA